MKKNNNPVSLPWLPAWFPIPTPKSKPGCKTATPDPSPYMINIRIYTHTHYTSLLNTCMTCLAHNSHVWTDRKKKPPLHAFKDHLLQPRAAASAISTEFLGPRPPGAQRPAGTPPPCPSSPSAAFPSFAAFPVGFPGETYQQGATNSERSELEGWAGETYQKGGGTAKHQAPPMRGGFGLHELLLRTPIGCKGQFLAGHTATSKKPRSAKT